MTKKIGYCRKTLLKTTLIALLFLLLPWIYGRPSSEQLDTKEIVVKHVTYGTGRGRSVWIEDEAGEIYYVAGKTSEKSVLNEKLMPGTLVQLKVYRGIYIAVPMTFIAELKVQDEMVIAYRNEQSWIWILCVTAGITVLGSGLLGYEMETHAFRRFRNWYRRCRKKRQKAITK